MSLPDSALYDAVMAVADKAECVVYLATPPVPAGSTLSFPGLTFECPWEALMAFVDLDPMANWSHRAKYVFVHRSSGETKTVDAHLPPFRHQGEPPGYRWRVLYQAPSVPDALLAIPNQGEGDHKDA